MADNCRKCDLCGAFFPIARSYKPISLPAHRRMSKPTMNGLTNENKPPYNFPIRCRVEMQTVDICSICLGEIIGIMRRLSKSGN